MHAYQKLYVLKASIHSFSEKGDLIKYFLMYLRRKSYARKVWFKQILLVNTLNKNKIVYMQLNCFVIDNYSIKHLNELNIYKFYLQYLQIRNNMII